MSAGGKALAQALGGFGQNVQALGETIYKVDAENEATKLQLSFAEEIEKFQQSLLIDPEPGTPGASSPEGYMARWEKFSQDLKNRANQAKNPLARKEVNDYLGKVIPSQGSRIAQAQFASWTEKQKADRRNNVLKFAMTASPEAALDFAAVQYGELLNKNAITGNDYTNLMREAAAPIMEKALFEMAKKSFAEEGETGAYNAVSAQLLYTAGNDTFTVSDQVRDTVKLRLNAHIQGEYVKARNHLGALQSNTYAKANGQPRTDADGNELPTLSLEAIDKSNLPESEKKPLRDWWFAMERQLANKEWDDGEKELWESWNILHRMNQGESVTEDEKKRALSATIIGAKNLPAQRSAFWTNILQGEEQVSKTNLIENQRGTLLKGIDALRRAAYSVDGKPATEEDATLIATVTDDWIDTFSKIPELERANLKEERARLTGMRAERTTQAASITEENNLYEMLGKLAKKAAGLEVDPADLPSEAAVKAAIDKIDPKRRGAFLQEANQVFTSIAKNDQARTEDTAFWGLVSKADDYRKQGTGITKEEINQAVKDRKISSSQGSFLLDRIEQADSLREAEDKARQKSEKALRDYKTVSDAYENSRRLAAGEILPMDTPLLTREFLKTLDLSREDLAYWESVILQDERVKASKEERLAEIAANRKEREDELKKAEEKARQKGEDALKRYNLASEAYRNLLKQYDNEKLPDGAKVLTTEYLREIGLDVDELRYWDSVLERAEANQDRLKAQDAEDADRAKKEADKIQAAKDAKTDAVARYNKAAEAYQNLQKKNAGETLAEGAPVLSYDYIRTLGLDEEELRYWDAVIERSAASKKQLDAIKGQAGRETRLVKALANTYEMLRTGKKDDKKEYITSEFVQEVYTGVEDPDAFKSWLGVAEQVETATKKKTEDSDAEAWRARVRKAEAASERKARGEDIGEEEELTMDLLDEAPAGIKEEEKTYYGRRVTTIADTAKRYSEQAGIDSFYTALGNTIRIKNGEDLGEGKKILTFEEIWANPHITGEMKVSADRYLREALGLKKDPQEMSDGDKKVAFDVLKAGQRILQRIKNGDTKNTKWTYYKNGKPIEIDLAKNGEAEWNKVVNAMLPYLPGYLTDIEDLRTSLAGEAKDNPQRNRVDEIIAAYEKRTKTTLSVTSREELQEWAYSQADQNPDMAGSKFASLIEEGIAAKTVGFNFKNGLDLNTNYTNSAEDFVLWLSQGKGSFYMGNTKNGLLIPAHPAVRQPMEQLAGKLREAMSLVPNGANLKFGPTGQALEYWGADGQRWIIVNRDQLGKGADDVFKSLGAKNATNEVQHLQFFLGNVDGQAHIIMRTTMKSGGAYEQALYGKEWKSLYPTNAPYIYESYAARNKPAKVAVPKPGEPGFVPPNSYYPGMQ